MRAEIAKLIRRNCSYARVKCISRYMIRSPQLVNFLVHSNSKQRINLRTNICEIN